MRDQNYTISFSVDESPEEVFSAINNVRGWWSQAIEGDTDKLGAVFYYHYQNVHRCTFKITGFVPGRKLFGMFCKTTLTLSKKRPSGPARMLSLKLPGRVAKQKFTSRMLDLCPKINAMVFARTHGARTSPEVCATSLPQAKVSQTQ